jgi:hypothetical protein
MANPEDAAKSFLKGLGARKRMPWDEPMGGDKPAAKPSPKPAAKAADSGGDSIDDQVSKITERNREFAKRTRYLRKD